MTKFQGLTHIVFAFKILLILSWFFLLHKIISFSFFRFLHCFISVTGKTPMLSGLCALSSIQQISKTSLLHNKGDKTKQKNKAASSQIGDAFSLFLLMGEGKWPGALGRSCPWPHWWSLEKLHCPLLHAIACRNLGVEMTFWHHNFAMAAWGLGNDLNFSLSSYPASLTFQCRFLFFPLFPVFIKVMESLIKASPLRLSLQFKGSVKNETCLVSSCKVHHFDDRNASPRRYLRLRGDPSRVVSVLWLTENTLGGNGLRFLPGSLFPASPDYKSGAMKGVVEIETSDTKEVKIFVWSWDKFKDGDFCFWKPWWAALVSCQTSGCKHFLLAESVSIMVTP